VNCVSVRSDSPIDKQPETRAAACTRQVRARATARAVVVVVVVVVVLVNVRAIVHSLLSGTQRAPGELAPFTVALIHDSGTFAMVESEGERKST